MKRKTAPAVAEGPLFRALAQTFALDEGEARSLVRAGAVYVEGRRARDDEAVVRAGATLTAVLEEGGRKTEEPAAPPPTLSVLFEGDGVLAVDKPAGMVAQPTPGRVGDSLLDLASAHLGREAGLVHRLDRETSGVTVFGTSRDGTSALAAEFREGRAKKTYLAVTHPGLPSHGLIELPLSKDPSRPGRWRASDRANGVPAVTYYTRLQSTESYCVVQLEPHTGRTHQLRAHLTGIGFPILGDRLYESALGLSSDAPRCLLHAQRLLVLDYDFVAPLPADFTRWMP